jgi:PIN domain nuclease of toxin-antitoxin system
MKYVLDTHAWIWWNSRPEALTPKTRKLLTDAKGDRQFLLSAISVWEFCKLVERGRLTINIAAEEWISAALAMPRLELSPLTPRIAYASTMLPVGMHNDPADQIIVATSRIENAPLITCDERLLRYPHVKTMW